MLAKRRKGVHIFTAGDGVEAMDCQFNDKTMIERCIANCAELPHVSVYAKCFNMDRSRFANPRCIGEHIENLKCLQTDEAFARQAKSVKRLIQEEFAGSSAPVYVLFWCRQGRHRSIVTARAWMEILRRRGFTVWEVVHLSRRSWRKNQCFSCESCQLENPMKGECFDALADKHWPLQ